MMLNVAYKTVVKNNTITNKDSDVNGYIHVLHDSSDDIENNVVVRARDIRSAAPGCRGQSSALRRSAFRLLSALLTRPIAE